MYSIKKYTNWLSPGSFSRKLHTLSSHNLCQWSNTILQRKIDNNNNNIKKKPIILTGSHENDFNITSEER